MEKASPLPIWIYKRDGRLVPFEGDKISQSLFAAGEMLGRPDAFTARELTDSVLHFLTAELNGAIPRTDQVADTVTKVVRELGQTAIAQAYSDLFHKRDKTTPSAEKTSKNVSNDKGRSVAWTDLPNPEVLVGVDPHSVWRSVAAGCLEDYSLRRIFTRDIAAAHKEGLIALTGLDSPFEIQGGLGPRIEPGQLAPAMDEVRCTNGQFIVLDGPEFMEHTPEAKLSGSENVAEWVRDFLIWLRAVGLFAVVNLNTISPPPWARSLAAGPLFQVGASRDSQQIWASRADELLAWFCSPGNEWTHVHWHLSERDWEPQNEARLFRLARFILQGAPITISFDRPNRPISLAEGMDRKYAGVLISVGLHLPILSRQLGRRTDPEIFLQKLGSLARLAITAAVQKRRFLTRFHRPRAAFLVDRARLAVVPVGLESVTREFTGQGICVGTPGIEFAKRVVHGLHEILREEGPRYILEITVDSAMPSEEFPIIGPRKTFRLESGFQSISKEEQVSGNSPSAKNNQTESPSSLSEVAGLTVWNPSLSPWEQVEAAGQLHAITGTGTAWVQYGKDASVSDKDIIDLLRLAWKASHVNRIRFTNPQAKARQLTASWETSDD